MNRNVVIGGVGAAAVVLGGGAWYFLSGGSVGGGGSTTTEPQGPIALNVVNVITEHGAAQTDDGRKLSISFPKFELTTKAGETTSSVFSTTWNLKVGPDERVLVVAGTVSGYMKSSSPGVTAAPAPAPAPASGTPAPVTTPGETPPATSSTTAPAADAATPAAPGTTPPAEQPKPAAPAPAKPVAGDGVARLILNVGGETTVTEWRDANGEGADRKVAKAVAFTAATHDLRQGATIPVTVTLEVSGGVANETIARVNSIDLTLFAENAPLPKPEAATPATDTAATPPADGTAPATPATDAATPPADGTTPAAPADGTTPPAPAPATPPAN